MIATLAVYEEGRRQGWFGKGHPNDPTRLFGIFLRNLCLRWLSHAPCNAITLRQVTALRQYLEALAREQVFSNESQEQDSMTVLLHNLATPLTLLEKRLQHEISLQSAREHFNEAKNGISEALNEAAQYLFCALAAKDRTKLPFSLVNMQARVVNKQPSPLTVMPPLCQYKIRAYARNSLCSTRSTTRLRNGHTTTTKRRARKITYAIKGLG